MGSSNFQAQRLDSGSVESYIHILLDRYPTPQPMRSTANKISDARQDTQASEVTRLMRQLADAMESSELYTD